MDNDAMSAEAAAALQARLHGDQSVQPPPGPNSEDNMSMDGADGHEMHEGFSPRRGHTHKRPEEPPKNEQGKMICKFQGTCTGLTFDRKCEWSKHMDKHERPYKCEAQGCEKLQGFTYSGGLLRHQREVHKMHGGTKEPLYCHYMNCKRSSGAGFTRKENRDEHIRRVHRRATDGADGSTVAKRDREDMEAADALLRGDVSQVEVHELDTENVDPIANTPAPKRRRITQPATHHSNGNSNSNGISNGVIDPAIDSDLDLKAMVKHLQETNNLLVKQNDTIRRDHQLLSDRLNRLEESLGRNGVPVPEPMLGSGYDPI